MSTPRVKHKYVPPSQRPSPVSALSEHLSFNAQLELTSEAEPHMFTVEDLYAKGKGSLSDSMWAHPSQKKFTSRPNLCQQNKMHLFTKETLSPVKIENLSPHHPISHTPSSLSENNSPISVAPHMRASSPITPVHHTIAPHLQRTMSPLPASCGAPAEANMPPHLRGPSSNTATQDQTTPRLRGKPDPDYQSLSGAKIRTTRSNRQDSTGEDGHGSSMGPSENMGCVTENGPVVDKGPVGQPLLVARQLGIPNFEDSMHHGIESPADMILKSVNRASNGRTPPGTFSWSGPSLNTPPSATAVQPSEISAPLEPGDYQKKVSSIGGSPAVTSERTSVLMSGDQWFDQKNPSFDKARPRKPSGATIETRLPVDAGAKSFLSTREKPEQNDSSSFPPQSSQAHKYVNNGKIYKSAGLTMAEKVIPTTQDSQISSADRAPKIAEHSSQKEATKENVGPLNFPDHIFISSDQPTRIHNKLKPIALNGGGSRTAMNADPWYSGHDLSDPNLVKQMILTDLNAQSEVFPSGSALTYDALAKTTGFKHRERSNSFDDKVSDSGVSIQAKEIVRATQGRDPAEELLDWDKTWLAPPCDRENSRGSFDDKFMPAFIKEWSEHLPHLPNFEVNTSSKEFLFGTHAVENHKLLEPIVVPDSIPDDKCSEDNMKRLQQTSQLAATLHSKKASRRQKVANIVQVANSKRREELEMKGHEPNPFSPSIAIYLRPVMEKDAAAIATIYNYYVNNSIITEDQEVLQESDALFLINNAKFEKLPFVVAVRGREPPVKDAQGRCGATAPILPHFESVIGFSFTEIFNFGFSGGRAGRSRATANLQLYVHHDYMHKGVGRNLLDRLLHSMSQAYSFKNGASWINSENDKTYDSSNLVKWHQIFIQLPVDPTGDSNYARVHDFLTKFFFNRVACLSAAARKSPHPGPARFLDLVIYQAEATHNGDFDTYI